MLLKYIHQNKEDISLSSTTEKEELSARREVK